MRCVQAVWPTESVNHEVIAVSTSGDGVIWTGAADGGITKWTVSEDGVTVVPELFMFGHRSPVKSLVKCVEGSGKEVLVSVDSEGQFCSWDCLSGVCQATCSHPELAGAIGTIAHHLGGRHVCFALDHSQNGVEGESGSPRRLHALVALDGVSLDLLEVWHPDISIDIFQEKDDGSAPSCCIPVLLDLVSFPQAKSSYRDLDSMIGISSAGKVLYWQFSGEKPVSSEIMSWLLPDPCEPLPTPLGAVSITRDGKKILLVSQSGWCLLTSNSDDDGTAACPSKFQKLTGGTDVGGPQPEDFGHLAGGFILQENWNEAGKGEEILHKLVFWDWSGRGVETVIASDGAGENGVQFDMQVPKDCMGDGFFTFVQARKGGMVHGVWSTCTESWASGEEKDSISTKFDAGVNVFMSDIRTPFSVIGKNSLSAVWDPGEHNRSSVKQVTCLAVVGGVNDVPYTLVQGFSSGEITFSSLAAYAIPVPLDTMRNGLKTDETKQGKRRVGHWGPVTCLVELSFEPSLDSLVEEGSNFVTDGVGSGNFGKGMLASGGVDGSVRFWSLEAGEIGSQLFCVHPHTGSVERITTSPPGSVSPWCECVATFGDDGIASLISMETRKVERIMSGHPFGSFERIQWDGRRGFMACYGLMIGRVPHLVIWDLYSNLRDRTFVGEVAERAFDQFCHRVEAVSGGVSSSSAEVNLVAPFQEATASRVVQVDQQEKLLRIVEGPKKDIAFIEIDLPGLLSSQDSSMSISCSVSFGCVLSLLHAWGIQQDSDIQLATMLHALALTEPVSDTENPPPSADKIAKGISLTQGVVESRNGAVTVQVPYHVEAVFSSDGKVVEKKASMKREAVAGPLWRHCPDFVARELICLVAISKKLMHDGLNETVCSACSSLVKLYAIEFLQSVPQVSDPSLDVLVQLWEDSNPILKETARVLLASMTDPGKLMSVDSVDGIRSLGSAEVKDVIAVWTGVGSNFQPGTSPRHDAAILVAGAVCCVHSRLISDELLVATAPLLGILATSPKSQSCATAAAMLADALMAMEGEKWRNALGDTHYFMQRLFNSCDEIHVGELESNSDAPVQAVPAPPPSNPKSVMRHAKSMVELKLNDSNSNRSALESSPSQETISEKPATQHHRTKTPFEMLKASSSKISRKLSPSRRSHSILAGEAGHFVPPPMSSPFTAGGPGIGERSETVRYKEALVSVLMAIASLDLRLFMHSLASRLSGQTEHQDPYCVVSAAGALARLLHQRDGPRKIVFHLPLLISVLMRTLDPAQHGMRRVAHQGVHALLSEFATVFGMIDSDRVNNLFAVGYALAQQQRPGTNALPEAIAVYDLQTGSKKKSLTLGRVLQQTGGHLGGTGAQTDQSGALGIGVLSFRRDGDVLAAYCPGAGVLCVWDLRSSWQHRLIKGPSQLEPIKVIQIHQVVDPNTWLSSYGSELKISWQLANQVAVMQGDKQLASVELHLGG